MLNTPSTYMCVLYIMLLLKHTYSLESIQGTCRLSLKMGRGDEQKPMMHCIRR